MSSQTPPNPSHEQPPSESPKGLGWLAHLGHKLHDFYVLQSVIGWVWKIIWKVGLAVIIMTYWLMDAEFNMLAGLVKLVLGLIFGVGAGAIIWATFDAFKLANEFCPLGVAESGLLAKFKHTVVHGYKQHAPLLQFTLRMAFIGILAALLQADVGDQRPFGDPTTSIAVASAIPHTATADVKQPAHHDRQESLYEWIKKETQVFRQPDAFRRCLGWLHGFLLLSYLVTSFVCLIAYLSDRKSSSLNKGDRPKWLAEGSLLDVVFVALLMATSLVDSGHLHLAYVIPLVGVWWMTPEPYFVLRWILFANLARFLGTIIMPTIATQLNIVGFVIVDYRVAMITLGYWCIFASMVMLLRIVQKSLDEESALLVTEKIGIEQKAAEDKLALENQAKEEIFFRHALESLAERQQHVVFAKDRKRKFTYANSVLLQWLTGMMAERNRLIDVELERFNSEARRLSAKPAARGASKAVKAANFVEPPKPPLKTKFCRKKDLQPVSSENPIEINDIIGLDDFDLGIDCEEYLRSDAEVLGLTKDELRPFAERLGLNVDELNDSIGERTPIFEDFEPTFTADKSKDRAIWTTKLRLCSDVGDGVVVGLVGEASSGYPVQMQKLAELFNDSLPVYALMKKPKAVAPGEAPQSHVVWSNRLHMRQIKPRLLTLAKQQHPKDVFENCPEELLLQKINGGDGPTDADLYGRKGKRSKIDSTIPELCPDENYATDDKEITDRANKVIKDLGSGATLESIHQAIAVELKKWAAKERKKHVEDYPKRGWIERHRFPDSDDYIWVEVRKWPWIESRTGKGGKQTFVVRGVLVLFEDVTQGYIRRNVVWRWVRRHLKHAERASSAHLRKSDKLASEGSATPLLELELVMLGWFRKLVDKPKENHQLEGSTHTTDELQTLIHVLEHMEDRCRVDVLGCERALQFTSGGRELLAIVIALIINAGQSTIARGDGNRLETKLTVATVGDELVISIKDQGVGFGPEERVRIMDGLCWGNGEVDGVSNLHKLRESERVLMPGGGILLVKYLLRSILNLEHDQAIREHNFNIISNLTPGGKTDGATAFVRIPWKSLGSPDGQPLYLAAASSSAIAQAKSIRPGEHYEIA